MANEFIVKKGLIATGSVTFPNIPQGTTETNIVLKDNIGNLVLGHITEFLRVAISTLYKSYSLVDFRNLECLGLVESINLKFCIDLLTPVSSTHCIFS